MSEQREHACPVFGDPPRPRREVVRVTHQPGVRRVTAPAAAVIGWIPHYGHLAAAPEGYRRQGRARGLVSAMLLTGNGQPPPHRFADERAFVDYLDNRSFRFAVFIDQAALIVDERGHVVDVAYEHFSAAGYTPVPSPCPELFRSLSFRGSSQEESYANVDPHGATIVLQARFRVSPVANLGARVLGGGSVPWAPVSIHARIEVSGAATIRFGGAWLPSQTHYVDWEQVGPGHDMSTNTRAQVQAFFDTSEGRQAPARVHHVWSKAEESGHAGVSVDATP